MPLAMARAPPLPHRKDLLRVWRMAGGIAAGGGDETCGTGMSSCSDRIWLVRAVLEGNAGKELQVGMVTGNGGHLLASSREPLRVHPHVVGPEHVRPRLQRHHRGLDAPHGEQIQPYRESRVLPDGCPSNVHQFNVRADMRNQEHTVRAACPCDLDFGKSGGCIQVMDHGVNKGLQGVHRGTFLGCVRRMDCQRHAAVRGWAGSAEVMDATKASKSCEVRMLKSTAVLTGARMALEW